MLKITENVSMMMWPLCLIADSLVRMAGGRICRKDEDDVVQLPDLQNRSCVIDVVHVRQRFEWDCGLACVLMVLRTLGIDDYDIHDLQKICGTQSIWTVDLAYLLHNLSINFSFFTVTLCANPEYSAESFYNEQLQDDIQRVDQLFEKALDVGISIQCRSISGKDLSIIILSGRYVAIALVDKTKLGQCWLEDTNIEECYGGNSDYIGHYVLICGYDAETCAFEIRDPANPRTYETIHMECLDIARKSFGTDEDILLVHMNGNYA